MRAADFPDAYRKALSERVSAPSSGSTVVGFKSIAAYRVGLELDGRRPTDGEVAAVYRIPLGTIEHDAAFDFTAIPESARRVIRFHWDDRLIHAPTAAMIYQFREVLAGRDTRVADLEQPVFAWK